MAIPETQLDTWSKQGSVSQSQTTYQTVKGVLEAADAPYRGKSFVTFLQGSYGNDTNIYADSDVDVVIRLDSTYYDDTSSLSEDDKAAYLTAFVKTEYSYANFKKDVMDHLVSKFGNTVKSGKKAIFIPGNQSRRDVDVLPAVQYRNYISFRSSSIQSYVDGIVFWSADGTKIVNYPKQHSANCTTKHQDTLQWFKPMVRILKNMRNRMIQDGVITEGLAPSYFVEGLLYNVPDGKFGTSYSQTFASTFNWLREADHSKFVCANGQYYLLNPASPVTWRVEKYIEYRDAAIKYWNNWK